MNSILKNKQIQIILKSITIRIWDKINEYILDSILG